MRFGAADWSLFFTYAFATVVGTIETVGDAIAVQKVSQRDFRKVDYGVVQGAVYADGVGNFLSGLAGTTPNTTYSSNIALMELNGVAARRVGFYAAAFLALLAFFPKVSALVLDIPGPALGAAVFLLLCRLFVTGIRIATKEGITPETILVVGVAFRGGYAAQNALFFPDLIPVALRPLAGNGIAAGGALALLLTLLGQLKPRPRTTQRVSASLSQLPDLRRFVDRLEGRFGVPAKSLHNLQLCSEEVFAHLCSAEAAEGAERLILFRASLDEDVVTMEITDRSVADDVDLPTLPDNWERASSQDLQDLGLLLVSKLAEEVRHLRISGYNYISFTIPRQ